MDQGKICVDCMSRFLVTEDLQRFLALQAPVFDGQQIPIPAPTRCPECRLRRRLAFRNPIHVGWRISATTGEKMLSAYVGEHAPRVIENDEWWSDSWDALSYGRACDLSAAIFPQLKVLRDQVPYAARLATKMENSDYCSNVVQLKNCYLVFNTFDAEDSMYCDYIWGSKDCIECTRTIKSEACYDCLECHRCYELQSSEYCEDCSTSYFLSHCRACRNCFCCANLYRKEFCIFNEQHTQSSYQRFLRALDLTSYNMRQSFAARLEELVRHLPRPHFYGQRCEDVSGNFLYESRRVYASFYAEQSEDCTNCFVINGGVKDCYDYSHFGHRAERLYECQSCGHDVYNLSFCRDCWESCTNLLYCSSCFGSHDCFGCVGLRKKQYCIFNLQYRKEDYLKLVPQIVSQMQAAGEWGEFFPIDHSPFPYNLSFAHRYFPLSKDQCRVANLEWFEKDNAPPQGSISADKVPEGLPVNDTPLNIISSESGRVFRVTSEEIRRYRKLKAPLPRETYDERMERRFKRLGGIRLYERRCGKSGKPLLSIHAPSASYPVWSKEEYERELCSVL